MSTELMTLSNALAEATARAAAGAVAVHTEARGSSSGVVWHSGLIVTAEHALERDSDIRVTLADGRAVEAKLAGRDPSTDLAVLKCKELASRLGISEHTAKIHVASILGKLGAGSRTEAVAIGIRRGLVML